MQKVLTTLNFETVGELKDYLNQFYPETRVCGPLNDKITVCKLYDTVTEETVISIED